MLYYNRIDDYEGIDINKTSESKNATFCYYWYGLNKDLKFQPSLLMMSLNL